MSALTPVVVVAPDSLKGSCSAVAAAAALASGIRAALGERVLVRELPLADGGEGTREVLVAAWGGSTVAVPTTDALGRARTGFVGFSADGRRAIIEAADANGLPAVSDQPLHPLDADSAGVGALVRAALDVGVDEILLCVGGSATSDGGAGLLRALGARLLDAVDEPVAGGARGLAQLHRVDLSGVDARAARVRWRIACDVTNPLLGMRGAAAVFGPQKGATPEEVRVIDAGLSRLLRALVAATSSVDAGSAAPLSDDTDSEVSVHQLSTVAGLGAAGGLGLGPVLLFDAELVPGSRLVSEAVGLRGALAGATAVVTGEGRLDAQSLHGKVVSEVVDAARAAGVPGVFVVAGAVALTAQQCREAGISAAVSIAPGPATLAELQGDARQLLSEAAAHLAAGWTL